MRIHLYTSDAMHPVFPALQHWVARRAKTHQCLLTTDQKQLAGGDILFLVSASSIIPRSVRSVYRAAIVLHASDLPKGRGWSPHVWAVLEGATELIVTALEAVDEVDTGPIYAQTRIAVEPHELFDEIHEKLFSAEIALLDEIVDNFESLHPTPQADDGATYYRRRTPEDSRMDPHASIAAQFDLLRICDPDRYPAFFELRGKRYEVILRKSTPKRGSDASLQVRRVRPASDRD